MPKTLQIIVDSLQIGGAADFVLTKGPAGLYNT
jgi:hypothetical protein